MVIAFLRTIILYLYRGHPPHGQAPGGRAGAWSWCRSVYRRSGRRAHAGLRYPSAHRHHPHPHPPLLTMALSVLTMKSVRFPCGALRPSQHHRGKRQAPPAGDVQKPLYRRADGGAAYEGTHRPHPLNTPFWRPTDRSPSSLTRPSSPSLRPRWSCTQRSPACSLVIINDAGCWSTTLHSGAGHLAGPAAWLHHVKRSQDVFLLTVG